MDGWFHIPFIYLFIYFESGFPHIFCLLVCQETGSVNRMIDLLVTPPSNLDTICPLRTLPNQLCTFISKNANAVYQDSCQMNGKDYHRSWYCGVSLIKTLCVLSITVYNMTDYWYIAVPDKCLKVQKKRGLHSVTTSVCP